MDRVCAPNCKAYDRYAKQREVCKVLYYLDRMSAPVTTRPAPPPPPKVKL